MLGTALLQVLRNLVNLLDIPSSLDFAVMGAVILIGAVADQVFGREKGRGQDMNRRLTHGLAVLAAIGIVACAHADHNRATVWQARNTVQLYTLTNKHGLVARITNYGAIVTELHVPDRDGTARRRRARLRQPRRLSRGHPYFGAIVGRVANRIGNAAFTLEGKRYTLEANDKPHHLHGGRRAGTRWCGTPLPSTPPTGRRSS